MKKFTVWFACFVLCGRLISADQPDGSAGATKETPFVNSLGMKFVPVPGTKVLFSIWDTRVQDYRAYAAENPKIDMLWHDFFRPGSSDKFVQGEDYPVVQMSWNEAKDFCDWLTQKERKAGKLGRDQAYRLPTDQEWSAAVGQGKYPWGNDWPPPKNAGNYDKGLKVDDYPYTSPVGAFAANPYGLYDMGGNVWQWCQDVYRPDMNDPALLDKLPFLKNDGGNDKKRVMRGASWRDSEPERLQSSLHSSGSPGMSDLSYGFRCVLESGLPITAPPKRLYLVCSQTVGEYDVAAGAVIKKDEPRVGTITRDGKKVAAFVSSWGVAFSGGNLYVTDFTKGTIGKYSAATGAEINASLVTGLKHPTGIAISGDNIFVVYRNDPPDQTGSGNIGEYTTSGETVNATLVKGLTSPWDIAVSGGNIFVTGDRPMSQGGGMIGEYTTSGATVNATLVQGLGSPQCIAVSGDNIFVGQSGPDGHGGGRDGIYEYSTSGAPLNSHPIKVQSYPHGLAVSGDDLFVSVEGFGVEQFTTSGATVNQSLIYAPYPYGIAVDDSP